MNNNGIGPVGPVGPPGMSGNYVYKTPTILDKIKRRIWNTIKDWGLAFSIIGMLLALLSIVMVYVLE